MIKKFKHHEPVCFLTQSKRELSAWAAERHWNIVRSNGSKPKGYVILSSKKRGGTKKADRLGAGPTLQWAFWWALNHTGGDSMNDLIDRMIGSQPVAEPAVK